MAPMSVAVQMELLTGKLSMIGAEGWVVGSDGESHFVDQFDGRSLRWSAA